MKRRPRSRIPALKWALLAALCAACVYYVRERRNDARAPRYPANAFHEVKRGDMLVSVTEDGSLRALNETIVRSGLEGLNRIIHLVPEGANVKKGELLVEFDSAGLRDRLNEQELAYQERLFQFLQAAENLKIRKSLGESQIKEGELEIVNAQDDLEKYRDGEAPLLIKTIENRSNVLAEQVRIASERRARTEELVKNNNASRSELEADALSLQREKLALEQYQEDLRLIKKFDQPNQIRLLESKVEQARSELERLRQRTSNEIAEAEADLKTSERSVRFLEEGLKTQKRRVENAKIFAPQDGLVVYAPVSQFQYGGDGGGGGRRDEGRFRGGRGGSDGGEFRGGRGRGGAGTGDSTRPAGSTASTSQATSAANQRIASAISGSSAAQSGAGLNSAAGAGGGSGGARGGGGASGQAAGSAASVFATYPSMRPSSTLGAGGASTGAAANGSSGGAANSGAGASASASANSYSGPGMNNQLGFRSSQNFQNMDWSSASGVLEEGAVVRQRQELIRLPDVSKMIAEIKIHESRVRQVRAGMAAFIRIENIPGRKFKGTVRRVALLPDATMSWMNPDLKVFPTDILVDEELPILKPGVSARAEVIITNLSNVLTVPIQTVARLRGENVCFVKRGNAVAPVAVETGWSNDRFAEIKAGLHAGDLVLLAPVGDEAIVEVTAVDTNAVDSLEQTPREEPAQQERRRGSGGRRQRTAEGTE